MLNYYPGRFIVIEEVQQEGFEGPATLNQPAMVIGVKQIVTVVTPGGEVRTFNKEAYDPEWFNEDGTRKT